MVFLRRQFPGRAAVRAANPSSAGEPKTPNRTVALISLTPFRFPLRTLPTVRRKGLPDIVRFLELTLRVPTHAPLVRAGVDQLDVLRPFASMLSFPHPSSSWSSLPCASPSVPPWERNSHRSR